MIDLLDSECSAAVGETASTSTSESKCYCHTPGETPVISIYGVNVVRPKTGSDSWC